MRYDPKKSRPEKYKLCVFHVTSKNVRGIPMTLRLLEEEETIEVKDGMEFVTGYLMVRVLEGNI